MEVNLITQKELAEISGISICTLIGALILVDIFSE